MNVEIAGVLQVFIDTLGLSLIIPVLPFFARDMGVNAFQFGLLMTAYSATQARGPTPPAHACGARRGMRVAREA